MKGFRLAPRGDYLVARAIKDAKKVKKVRKKVKKEAVIKGGTYSLDAGVSQRPILTASVVDDFKKECQDIQKQLFSGTTSPPVHVLPTSYKAVLGGCADLHLCHL